MIQFIGAVIFIIGFILLIGNVTGWWPTVPYAGYITMLIGGLIARVGKDN